MYYKLLKYVAKRFLEGQSFIEANLWPYQFNILASVVEFFNLSRLIGIYIYIYIYIDR